MKRSLWAVACLWVMGTVSPASAYVLYSVSWDQAIYKVNRTTATIDLYKPTPGIQWYGATDGPTETSFFATGNGGSLYQIDVVADTMTPIGTYGAKVNGLAYREPSPDEQVGVLYGTDYYKLYEINMTTGVASLIGSFGAPQFIGMWSMDWDGATDQLLMINQLGTQATLYRVDTATGAATIIAPITGASYLADIWYDHDSGKLLAVQNETGTLFEIDRTTGQATQIGASPLGSNLLGLGSTFTDVPEPGMVALLGLGVLGLGLWGRRRRSR